MIKKSFDRTNYNKKLFQQLLNKSDWGKFYNQDCAEGKFKIFSNIMTRIMQKMSTNEKNFHRNDKILTLLFIKIG